MENKTSVRAADLSPPPATRFEQHDLYATTVVGTLVPIRELLHPLRPLKYKVVTEAGDVYQIVESDSWDRAEAHEFHLKKVGVVGLLDAQALTLIAQRVFIVDRGDDSDGPSVPGEFCPFLAF